MRRRPARHRLGQPTARHAQQRQDLGRRADINARHDRRHRRGSGVRRRLAHAATALFNTYKGQIRHTTTNTVTAIVQPPETPTSWPVGASTRDDVLADLEMERLKATDTRQRSRFPSGG